MKTMRKQTVVRRALLAVALFGFELFLGFELGSALQHLDLSPSPAMTDPAAWHLPFVRPDFDQILSAMGR